jgi:tRNA G18 (ribose-2'-O)-methylase SpoU
VRFKATYSREKFCNFSFDAQLKAIAKLLKELEQNLANAEYRTQLIEQIQSLKALCKQALPPKMQDLVQDLPQDPHRLLRALAQYHSDAMVKDDQILLRVGDGSVEADPVHLAAAAQITVVADNLRSVFNVGSLFRVCECLAIGELVLCGISPDPRHPNMEKTALGTCSRVKWSHADSTLDAVKALSANGYRIYALETADPSGSVFDVDFAMPLALVVGNEALGIDPAVLKECDEIVHLPVLGWKNSLNVSVASSIALYQILFGGKHGNN